jgi:hypothetical protein
VCRIRSLAVGIAIAVIAAACSSGYEVSEPIGGVPEAANGLRGPGTTSATAPAGTLADTSSSAAETDRPVTDTTGALDDISAGCAEDSECEGLVTLIGPCDAARCDASTGQCVAGPAQDALPCEPDDPCVTQSTCLEGACVGVPISCDDGNPCTDESCVSDEGGCVSQWNQAPCDDGTDCTELDGCAEGVCGGQPTAACGCQVDLDCVPFDDGDLCNGALVCMEGQCAVADDSVVICDTAQDTDCAEALCDGTTGLCGLVALEDGDPCEDGNSCTMDDACEDGSCLSGPSTCQCESDADCAPFDDGNACNGVPICLDNSCVADPEANVVCAPSTEACHVLSCNPVAGTCDLGVAAEGSACDDGLLCTTADSCYGGQCLGAFVSCDDGNPCTMDGCDPTDGCTSAPTSGVCNDDDPCTTSDACVDGVCSGSPLDCDDEAPCTNDSCNDDGVCIHVSFDGACDDGDVCTTGDTCIMNSCIGTPNTCDDGVGCTKDSCTQGVGCAHTPDDALCDDASACTVGLCDFLGGCKQNPADNGVSCDDMNACTSEDSCNMGTCAGAPVHCDDGNPCTDDLCEPTIGCSAPPNALTCDDMNPCTEKDTCLDGTCSGLPIPGCGGPICGDGACQVGESCSTCPTDCGTCTPICGNGTCEEGEVCDICSFDCGACPATCGDFLCDPTESCLSCPGDCGPCQATCGDFLCDPTESCVTCSFDCGPCAGGDGTCAGSCGTSDIFTGCYCDALCFGLGDCCDDVCTQCSGDYPTECSSQSCGDGMCDASESCTSCPSDCGPCNSGCGDGTCDALNNEVCYTCPSDCGPCNNTSTCNGLCGNPTTVGDCYCDGLCFQYGDCCTDICTACTSSYTSECMIP